MLHVKSSNLSLTRGENKENNNLSSSVIKKKISGDRAEYFKSYYQKNRKKIIQQSAEYKQLKKTLKKLDYYYPPFASPENNPIPLKLEELRLAKAKKAEERRLIDQEKGRIRALKWWNENKERKNAEKREKYHQKKNKLVKPSSSVSKRLSPKHSQTRACLTESDIIYHVYNKDGIVFNQQDIDPKIINNLFKNSLDLNNPSLRRSYLFKSCFKLTREEEKELKEEMEKEVLKKIKQFFSFETFFKSERKPIICEDYLETWRGDWFKEYREQLKKTPNKRCRVLDRYSLMVECSFTNPSKLRGSKHKNPGYYGVQWNNPHFREERSLEEMRQLLKDGYWTELGAVGGKKTGNYYDSWLDIDPYSNSIKSPSLQKKIQKNTLEGAKGSKVIYSVTPSGGVRMKIGTCCPINHLTLYHLSKYGKRSLVGGVRGVDLYTALEGKGRQWFAEIGKISKRFKCPPNQLDSRQCIQQLIQWLWKMFWFEVKETNERVKTNGSIDQKKVKGDQSVFKKKSKGELEGERFLVIESKVKSIKALTGKDGYHPYWVSTQNRNNHHHRKKTGFIINAYRKDKQEELRFIKEFRTKWEQKMFKFRLRKGKWLYFLENIIDPNICQAS